MLSFLIAFLEKATCRTVSLRLGFAQLPEDATSLTPLEYKDALIF
jgi:hypothetical protein